MERKKQMKILIEQLSEQRLKDLYILVHWPYSQEFMDDVDEEEDKTHYNENEDGALFVPIQVYLDKIKELGE